MTTNPILTAFVAFILATLVVINITLGSYGYDGNFLENILVEAHGMLLDILVIGIFILWLNRSGEKLLEIRRYQEEIDDFRGWDSDEAGYRLAGNVKRLNRNGITNIRLEQCHLVNVNLSGANLSGADLTFADLTGANLSGADLTFAILRDANLSDALIGTNLSDLKVTFANLTGANLSNAVLSNAVVSGADLSGANLRDADLSGANLSSADLSSARNWTNEQLAQAEFLVDTTLPDGTVITEKAWEEFKKRYR